MSKNILFVEGADDRDFLQKFCNLSGLNNVTVEVMTPRDLGAYKDGWRGVVDNLPIRLKQLKNGDIDKLGIILDADYPPDNSGGFSSRYKLVTEKLEGYIIPKKPNFEKGDIFKHSDGLADVGLWVMPNHKDDGMLESFIEKIVSSSAEQQSLLNHAATTITSLPAILFNPKLHNTKASILSWRAWQETPGQYLNKLLENGVLDRSKASNFEAWLKNTFK